MFIDGGKLRNIVLLDFRVLFFSLKMTEYRIVYRTIFLYDYTRLILVLGSISLKFLENMKTVCSRMKKILF